MKTGEFVVSLSRNRYLLTRSKAVWEWRQILRRDAVKLFTYNYGSLRVLMGFDGEDRLSSVDHQFYRQSSGRLDIGCESFSPTQAAKIRNWAMGKPKRGTR